MNSFKTLLIAMLAALLGVGVGYWIFAENTAVQTNAANTSPETVQTYTCSMHPQIRQDEPGLCPICEMNLVPLPSTSPNSGDDPYVLEMTPAAAKLAQIETTVLGEQDNVVIQRTLSGKLQADERRTAAQVAHVSGRIEQLYVTFTGQNIRKGQKLADIYAPELVTAQRELLQAKELQEINPDLLQAARKKLQYWKISPDQIQVIETSGEIQETFTLFADAAGIVKTRRIAVGDYVQQGEVLFDILELSRLWIVFDAYEEDLSHIKMGDQIVFTTAALPGQTFSTTVNFIDPLINPETRVAAIRGEIANTLGIFKPEMLVKGQLRSQQPSPTQLLVPKSAVLWTGPRSVVYIQIPNTQIPTFRFQEVILGNRVGDQYVVKQGLQAGDKVVTYGNFAIDAAAQLNNKASMMNQDIQVKGQVARSPIPDFTSTTPESFQLQLRQLANSYLALKDSFVASDSIKARQAAQQLNEELQRLQGSILSAEAQGFWSEQKQAIAAHSAKVQNASTLATQRQQFDYLSQVMIQTIQAFGWAKDTLYVQHCPMAFDNQGADWLSDAPAIRNPYFGDKMLKCGEIASTISSPGSDHQH